MASDKEKCFREAVEELQKARGKKLDVEYERPWVKQVDETWKPVEGWWRWIFSIKKTLRMLADPDDAALRERMVARLRLLDTTEGVAPDGQRAPVPSVQVAPQDVTWERNREARPPTLRVAFDYVRVVRWPGLDRSTEKTFTVDLTEDVAIPDWGPAR